MSDLVERLRSPAQVFYEYSADDGAQLHEAATHIETLQAELAEARAKVERAKVERAREALGEAASALERSEAWLDHYAKLHKDKATKDGDQKAAVNLARSMEMGEAAEAARTALKEIEP